MVDRIRTRPGCLLRGSRLLEKVEMCTGSCLRMLGSGVLQGRDEGMLESCAARVRKRFRRWNAPKPSRLLFSLSTWGFPCAYACSRTQENV